MQPALALQDAADARLTDLREVVSCAPHTRVTATTTPPEEDERSSETRLISPVISPVIRQVGDSAETPASTALSANASFVEVQLPMRLSHKWVAYACRTANVAKPRWNRVLSVWTSATATETIAITASSDGMRIRILAEWTDSAHAKQESTTARRLATAFVTTMRDGMRRRTVIRECYDELSRAAAVRSHDPGRY